MFRRLSDAFIHGGITGEHSSSSNPPITSMESPIGIKVLYHIQGVISILVILHSHVSHVIVNFFFLLQCCLSNWISQV
jgi:hypothetical protein